MAGAAVSLSILPFLGSRPGVPEATAGGSPAAGSGSQGASSAAFDSDPELKSLAQSSSFWATPRQNDERLRDLNRRRVELAIQENVRIAKATLVLSRAPSSRGALQKGSEDSAALTITLAQGVPELARGEADSIRSIVECAFGLRPERIVITDNFHRFHRAYNDAGAPGSSSGADAPSRSTLGSTPPAPGASSSICSVSGIPIRRSGSPVSARKTRR